jgi:hypothetical protein
MTYLLLSLSLVVKIGIYWVGAAGLLTLANYWYHKTFPEHLNP